MLFDNTSLEIEKGERVAVIGALLHVFVSVVHEEALAVHTRSRAALPSASFAMASRQHVEPY